MVVACYIIIATDRIMAKFLYANEFYVAWKYVPFLTIAIVFGALSGYVGGFFTAVKDSKKFATSTILGAVLNVILNFISVPIIGTLGAAISTAASYIVVWAVRIIQSREYIKIKINWGRDISSYLVMFIQTEILLLFPESILMYGVQGILILGIVFLYKRELGLFIRKLRKE